MTELRDSPIEQLLSRVYRDASGQKYLEVHRDESTVTMVPEYPVGRERTMTIPLAMFEERFEQVNQE